MNDFLAVAFLSYSNKLHLCINVGQIIISNQLTTNSGWIAKPYIGLSFIHLPSVYDTVVIGKGYHIKTMKCSLNT